MQTTEEEQQTTYVSLNICCT